MPADLFFYPLALGLLGAGTLVIAARNPVYAVLALIVCFLNGAGLLILMGAEFLGFMLLIVYVGAVAVLFLFVVMMLGVDEQRDVRRGFLKPVGFALAMGGLLFAQMGAVAWLWPTVSPGGPSDARAETAASLAQDGGLQALGRTLYTDYALPFQMGGLILLVAMIGAVILTLHARGKTAARRQDPRDQVRVRREDVVQLCSPPSGQGIAP